MSLRIKSLFLTDHEGDDFQDIIERNQAAKSKQVSYVSKRESNNMGVRGQPLFTRWDAVYWAS